MPGIGEENETVGGEPFGDGHGGSPSTHAMAREEQGPGGKRLARGGGHRGDGFHEQGHGIGRTLAPVLIGKVEAHDRKPEAGQHGGEEPGMGMVLVAAGPVGEQDQG
jgi:hypothetical protein